MVQNRPSYLQRLAERRLVARWAELADRAGRVPLADLKDLQLKLQPLARDLARIDRVATSRLNMRGDAIRKPRGTDWAYRPDLWRHRLEVPATSSVSSPTRLDDESSIFHDCALEEISFRQSPTRSADALSPFDLQLEVFHFQGSFLSISIDLPKSVLTGLQAQHLFEVAVELTSDRPTEIYFRLNLRQDQDNKQLLQSLSPDAEARGVTFDLAYADLTPQMTDKVWLDVIFPEPAMNLFDLKDLTITRRPRADF